MDTETIKELDNERIRRETAVAELVDRVRLDRHIIACFIYGSTVRGDYWFNSDIDVILVSTDETMSGKQWVLVENGCWFEVYTHSRRRFREICEGAVGTVGPASMRHSGKLVYCTDSSLKEYFAEDGQLGAYEVSCQVLIAGGWCHFFFQKIEKYCGLQQRERAYNMLTSLIRHFAAVVILLNGRALERERVEQAMEVEPELFAPYPPVIYGPILEIDEIAETMRRIRSYIDSNIEEIFRLLIDFIKDEGRELPISSIHDRFSKVLRTGENNELIFGACEMLREAGILEQGEDEVTLSKRSTVTFTEPAYTYAAGGLEI